MDKAIETALLSKTMDMLEAKFPKIVESWALPIMVLNRDLDFVYANKAYLRATKTDWSDIKGKHVFNVFPDTAERVEPVFDKFKLCLDGHQTRLETQPFVLINDDGDEALHYWKAAQEPIFDDNGDVAFIVQYNEDVTDKVIAEQERKIIADELNHRVKNVLSVIQSIARLSSRGQTSVQDFTEEFIARIAAMNRNHGRLYENDFLGTTLEALLTDELDAMSVATDNIYTLKGESVKLDVQLSKDLSMVFHELATNAAKYGCFSTEAGRLKVTWETAEGVTVLKWRETGVGPVGKLSENGFGSTLIRMVKNIECEREPTDDGLDIKVTITHGHKV